MLVSLAGVKQLFRGERTIFRLNFVDENDASVEPVGVITLAGYEMPVAGGALADTDTLLEAIGKLENRIDALEGV